MEACPRFPSVSFDFKLAAESVNLCEKIPNYITGTYQENGENFTNECEQINRLRQNAINCTIDESGLKCLKRYYCQLLLLRNRFPMLPDTECAVRFTWEDAYQKEDNTYYDIRFEESCILYNIGALYSRLGANENRRTLESMKNACTYFRYAAGCFEKLRDQYTAYSIDLTPDLLTCQVDILLGQAHEAVLEKAFLDQRPASVSAHIAMQISEYYQRAHGNLMKPGMNSIVSKRFREWRVALTYKSAYYLSITYYCCGLISDENKKHGEVVCYFENALERLKDGWKNAEKISSDKTTIYKEVHTYIHDIITEKYKIVKRDNDNVYYEKVPSISNLPVVQGAIVAKPQVFDCHDSDISGPDIFQKLVPMDTHLTLSEYSEEKAKLLREIIELIDQKNTELQTFLSCLQLDCIPLTNEYLHLPRELLDCCAQISNHPNMTKDLMSSMQQLKYYHDDVSEQLSQFEQSLQTFEENPLSNTSKEDYKDLQTNLRTIREMIVQADKSNTELHRHTTIIIEHFNILTSPLEVLEKTLPVITEFEDEINKPKFARLGLLIEKIETMKIQRETLLNDLRQKIQNDDITKLILMRRQENHKNLFAEQIKKHQELINLIKQNCIAQENILQALTEANADIANIRSNLIITFDNRQRIIREYINSFKIFNETLSKVNEGIQFYQKQNEKVKTLNDRLTALQSQEQQPKQIITHSPLDVSTVSDRPRLKDYLATMKPETWGSKKIDENIYKSSSTSNMNHMNNSYYNSMSTSNPLLANMPNEKEPILPSLPTFNSQQLSMPYAPPPPLPSLPPHPPPPSSSIQPPMSFTYQPSTYCQSHSNLIAPPPINYNPSPAQQFPSQSIYSPSPTQTIPMHQSMLQNPSMYQYTNMNDSSHPRPMLLPSLPPKFDPYRPQPVGAYDIPTNQPLRFVNPQDVYRPGGLVGMTQRPMANTNYDPNQFMQYIPSSAASVTSSFPNLSINPMSNH